MIENISHLTKDSTIYVVISLVGGLVGVIGGTLGIWGWIDNYILKFNPKIFIGTRIIFETVTPHKVKSIICSLELCNHRKRYGIVYDIAVKIYIANTTNPHSAIYYADNVLDGIPEFDHNAKDNNKKSIFNPITILPSSNKTIYLSLSPSGSNNLIIENVQNNTYFIEFYYQKTPQDKWRFINKTLLYNLTPLSVYTKYVDLSCEHYEESRYNIIDELIPETHISYNGAVSKFFGDFLFRIKHRFLNIYRTIKNIIYTIPVILKLISQYLIDKFIRMYIIINFVKKSEINPTWFSMTPSFENAESAFDKLYYHLNKKIIKLNKQIKKSSKFSITKNSKKIVISRFTSKIIIDIFQDDILHAQLNHPNIGYKLELKESIWWNKELWHLDNKICSIETFAIKLLDIYCAHLKDNS